MAPQTVDNNCRRARLQDFLAQESSRPRGAAYLSLIAPFMGLFKLSHTGSRPLFVAKKRCLAAPSNR